MPPPLLCPKSAHVYVCQTRIIYDPGFDLTFNNHTHQQIIKCQNNYFYKFKICVIIKARSKPGSQSILVWHTYIDVFGFFHFMYKCKIFIIVIMPLTTLTSMPLNVNALLERSHTIINIIYKKLACVSSQMSLAMCVYL